MKTEEDEAFDDLAKRQGAWGGGFQAKRQMATDKLHWSDCAVHNGPAYPAGLCDCGATEPWNEDEWRRNNWRCGHGWLRGEQCEICNAAQPAQEPPSEWEGIKAILDEYGLQAIDFVADFKAAVAQPAQEPVAKYSDIVSDGGLDPRNQFDVPKREWVSLTDEEVELYWDWEDWQTGAGRSTIFEMVRDIEAKLRSKNT